jgi:hypothetical protein
LTNGFCLHRRSVWETNLFWGLFQTENRMWRNIHQPTCHTHPQMSRHSTPKMIWLMPSFNRTPTLIGVQCSALYCSEWYSWHLNPKPSFRHGLLEPD